MLKRLFVVLAISWMLLGCSSAQASQITYTFTGVVTYVDPSLAGIFNTSQTLSGSFTYESTTAGEGPYCSGGGCYADYVNALVGVTMNVGPYTASPPFVEEFGYDSLLQVSNNWGQGQYAEDMFLVYSTLTGAQLAGFNPVGMLSLQDNSQGLFSDTELTDVGDLTRWASLPNPTSWWYLGFGPPGGNPPYVEGTVTSITLTSASSMPEPSAIFLLGGGLLALAVARSRIRCFALR